MNAWMSRAGRAPTVWPTSRPPLNTDIIGMDWMRNRAARVCSSSVFTLATIRRPAFCCATLASSGATMRQGPHHSAQ